MFELLFKELIDLVADLDRKIADVNLSERERLAAVASKIREVPNALGSIDYYFHNSARDETEEFKSAIEELIALSQLRPFGIDQLDQVTDLVNAAIAANSAY
jgi:hypothetical protein